MDYRPLGRTGIDVSSLGFGTWPIGGTVRRGDYGAVSDDDAVAAIRQALDLGVTLFDTAPAYGDGRGEEILGQALAGRRDDAVIVTKCAVHWDHATERWITTSTREAIVASAERSLQRLRTDRLDVLLIHVPDPDRSPDGAMAAFAELQAAGTVRAVGVSNFTLEQIEAYLGHGALHVQQIGYHLFDRRIEDRMLPECERLGLGVMTYGALCHGLLSGTWTAETSFPPEDWRSKGDVFGLPLFAGDNLRRNVEVADRLKAFAAERGRTLPQLAIAWVVRNPAVAVALAGMRTPDEVTDNVQAVEWRLSDEEAAEVEAIVADAAGTTGMSEYVVNARSTDA